MRLPLTLRGRPPSLTMTQQEANSTVVMAPAKEQQATVRLRAVPPTEDMEVSGYLVSIETAHERIDRIRELMPALSNDMLTACIEVAESGGPRLIVLSGAAASELRSRASKLPGGRGRRDEAGVGQMAALQSVAQATGLSTRTIRENADIVETFLSDPDGPKDLSIPKDYYVAALGAPDPKAAAANAEERFGNEPGFTAETFRAEIAREKQAGRQTGPEVAREDAEELRRLSDCYVPARTLRAIVALKGHYNLPTIGDAVTLAVLRIAEEEGVTFAQ